MLLALLGNLLTANHAPASPPSKLAAHLCEVPGLTLAVGGRTAWRLGGRLRGCCSPSKAGPKRANCLLIKTHRCFRDAARS